MKISYYTAIILVIALYLSVLVTADNPTEPSVVVGPFVQDQYAYITLSSFPQSLKSSKDKVSVSFILDNVDKASYFEVKFSAVGTNWSTTSEILYHNSSNKFTIDDLFRYDDDKNKLVDANITVTLLFQLGGSISKENKYSIKELTFKTGDIQPIVYNTPIPITIYNRAGHQFAMKPYNIHDSTTDTGHHVGNLSFLLNDVASRATSLHLGIPTIAQGPDNGTKFIISDASTATCTVTLDGDKQSSYTLKPTLLGAYSFTLSNVDDKNKVVPFNAKEINVDCGDKVVIDGKWPDWTTLFDIITSDDSTGKADSIGINIISTGKQYYEQDKKHTVAIVICVIVAIIVVALIAFFVIRHFLPKKKHVTLLDNDSFNPY